MKTVLLIVIIFSLTACGSGFQPSGETATPPTTIPSEDRALKDMVFVEPIMATPDADQGKLNIWLKIGTETDAGILMPGTGLTVDSTGKFDVAFGSTMGTVAAGDDPRFGQATSLAGQPLSSATPNAGDVLFWDGAKWAPSAVASAGALSGQSPSISIGAVTSGSAASVVNSGSSTAAIFDFVLPKGEKGEQGNIGPQGPAGLPGVQGLRGESGIVSVSGTGLSYDDQAKALSFDSSLYLQVSALPPGCGPTESLRYDSVAKVFACASVAVDGSQITGLSAVAKSGSYADLGVQDGEIPQSKIHNLVSDLTDLKLSVNNVSMGIKKSCAINQTLIYLTPTDSFQCQAISIWATQVAGLSTVATSGEYNDLAGRPTNLSAFTNDAGYITPATLITYGQNVVLRDGSQAMTGNLNLGNHSLTNLLAPVAATDAATKAYVDQARTYATNAGNLIGTIPESALPATVMRAGSGTTTVNELKVDSNAQVSGHISARSFGSPVTDLGSTSSSSVSFSTSLVKGNINCSSIVNLFEMNDGASYTLVQKNTGTSTCAFAHAGVTNWKYQPANGPRVSGKETIYSFLKVGDTVYVWWTTGF